MNRDTHRFENAQPATLKGWRRIWRHTTLRTVAYLTVIPDADCEIDGLIAEVPDQDWDALDIRERAYDRVAAAHQIAHDLPHAPNIAVYAIPDGKHRTPDASCAVLLSYIDVVVQGYLREYGEVGAARFFATTTGWDAPVINDRATPRYPRHQKLTDDERALVDHYLRAQSVRMLDGLHAERLPEIWSDP